MLGVDGGERPATDQAGAGIHLRRPTLQSRARH
jgi:hypothetical protein